ncbi:MAG: 23S rRNA (adenine2503-C2)-methyltransferase [Bacteriovoracaceae bacterium]|jgi:23S rRNA (adenine2503-C2)-methyltransferase
MVFSGLRRVLKESFYNHSFDQLSSKLNSFAASILFNHYYKKKIIGDSYTNISKEHLEYIENNLDFSLPEIKSVVESEDRTVKFLIKYNDATTVEAVLIPFQNKYSLCLSSQVGCAMNCSFCYTGTQGLSRNLSTSEIIGQYLVANNWLRENRPNEERILNIVFMGQGEPLHNFDAVKKACEIFLSTHGASIGPQKITISTSGYLPGLKRWADEMPRVNLALSLHSPFKEKRDELIPINKKFPLEEVINYIDEIPLSRKQFITYEYLLIKDFNDSSTDARAVGELLQGKTAYINLIPFNPFPGSDYKRPDREKTEAFKKVLDEYKIPTLIRVVKGDDVLAACGQLNSKKGDQVNA